MRRHMHLEVVAAALALVACKFPEKVGDLPGTGTSGGGMATGSGGVTDTGTGGEPVTMGATGSGAAETSTMGATEASTMGATGSGAADESTTQAPLDLGGVETGTGGSMDCAGLEQEVCAQTPGCKAILGAPHVIDGGGMCVDDKNQVFLACDVDGGACPPFIPTVCPEGQVEPQFDVPSGCIPPGFENCEGGGLPSCP